MTLKIKSGCNTDEHLFSDIFKLHFDSLYNYGMRITGNRELVEDCIQEIFFRIWKNNIDLHVITNIKSYLLKALRRQILNILELKENQQPSLEINENLSVEFSPEDFYVLNQTEENIRNKVLSVMNKLPERQREAIYLKFFEDLGYREIAAIMNINIQSAKNTVFRGLNAMKKNLPGIMFLLVNSLIC